MRPEYILVYGAFPASVIFTLVFSITRKRWWDSILGWVIFSLALSINAVFLVSFLFFLGGDYPGRDIVKYVVYSMLALAFVAKTLAVIYERRRGDLEARARGRNPHS